ncbi:hypothetical protein [Nitrosococcus watsonii]|uniref:hypothetical protein n=1 Tax=Nitrosococcus watsonii TaxID=473531 RepID=UPI0012F77C87|nr:hypothetical protein [Nitrosococcus watsonii]
MMVLNSAFGCIHCLERRIFSQLNYYGFLWLSTLGEPHHFVREATISRTFINQWHRIRYI